MEKNKGFDSLIEGEWLCLAFALCDDDCVKEMRKVLQRNEKGWWTYPKHFIGPYPEAQGEDPIPSLARHFRERIWGQIALIAAKYEVRKGGSKFSMRDPMEFFDTLSDVEWEALRLAIHNEEKIMRLKKTLRKPVISSSPEEIIKHVREILNL